MGVIRNFDDLAVTRECHDALMIVEAGLAAINTGKVIKENVRLTNNQLCVTSQICSVMETARIFVVAVGKCAVAASLALEEILADRLTAGIALDVKTPAICTLKKIRCFGGTHPLPSNQNIEYTREIVKLLTSLTKDDLVVVVVSGGGSTLLCLPKTGTCLEERAVVEVLLRAGATIQEINTVRKHLSLARGGQLAKHAYPAQVLGLIFSDVPGDDFSFIASGPTVKDETTTAEAKNILVKYAVLRTCGFEHCGLIETPKDDRYFERVTNILLVSNQIALEAMENEAQTLGYIAQIVTRELTGEARVMGEAWAKRARAPKSCLLAGGETTVTVNNKLGQGGRNQELVLGALPYLPDNVTIISLASDGRDNSEVAGAIGNAVFFHQAVAHRLVPVDYLRDNNSYNFFAAVGGQIFTGHLDSNVSDLLVLLVGETNKND